MSSLKSSGTSTVLTYGFLVVAALVLLFPVFFTFVSGFMPASDIVTYPPKVLPDRVTGANYGGVLQTVPLGRQYFNSVLVSVAIMLGHLVTATLSAYAFVFLRMPGRRILFWLFLSTMMVPWEAIVIPNYLFIVHLGMASSYAGLIVPFLANGFGTFLLRQAFLQFPKDLRDASTVDGCGHLRFLWQILIPLSRPVLAALAVYAFLSGWNQFLWPLLVDNSDTKLYTLQIGIYSLQSVDTNEPGQIMAGITLALLPTLLLVMFGQRWLVRGLTAGAVK